MYKSYDYPGFKINSVERVLGRKAKADNIFVTCNTKFLDGNGGEEDQLDYVQIESNNCVYDIQVIVRPYTEVDNMALKGNFSYIVPFQKGNSSVKLLANLESNHNFIFDYVLADAKSVNIENQNSIKFDFFPKVANGNFNITILYNMMNNITYELNDGIEIKVGNKSLYAMQSTDKRVDEIIDDYSSIANNLKRLIFVQSLLNNETVAIGHGNHDVLHNDPYYKSHLVGNGGENIFVVTYGKEVLNSNKLPMPEVVIYDLDKENSIDTLDLRQIKQQIVKDLGKEVKAKTFVDNKDILVELLCSRESELDESVVTVRLKNALVANWHERLHVIVDNVPMKIEEFELKPLPLIFDESDINIIVIGPKDVEKENKVVVSREIGSYTFARLGNDLMITNAFDNNLMNDKFCTISLSGFYQEAKMKTLTIKFADQEIVLKDHQEQVDTTRDIDAIKKEQRDRIYNEVFNNTMNKNISSEVILSNETTIDEVKENRQNQSSRTRRAIDENEKYAASSSSKLSNSIFNWVKELISGLLSSKAALPGSFIVKPSISQVDGQFAKALVSTTSTTPPSDGTGKKQGSNYFTGGNFLRDNVDYVNANLKQAHERQMPGTFKPKGGNTILEMGDHYLSQTDSNGTIMLLDLFIRKVTGQRFTSSVDQSISLLDVQASALPIIEEFKRVLNKTAIKSGISVTNLNFNPVPISTAIAQHLRNGKFSEVSKTLYLSAKEACPEFKQNGKFLTQLKSYLVDVLVEKEAAFLLNKQKVEVFKKSDQSMSTPRKAIAPGIYDKPKTFLNGTSITIGMGNNLGA